MIDAVRITISPDRPYDIARFGWGAGGKITHTIQGVYRLFNLEVRVAHGGPGAVDVYTNRILPDGGLEQRTTRLLAAEYDYEALHQHFDLDEVIRKARILIGEEEEGKKKKKRKGGGR
jgi:hypothetical protein